jgi:hypothetical protein
MYYTNIEPGGFNFDLYIIPHLKLILTDIETYYGERHCKYEHGPITAIELEDDKIILEIPKQAVCGWKMDALNPLKMSADNIKDLSFHKTLIPFQVSVSWIGDGGSAQKRLTRRVYMKGVKKGLNFLTVTTPGRFCTGSTLVERSAAGLAILVTCDYEANSTLKTLKGTNVDAVEMRATFEQFSYEIHQLRNGEATKNAITSLLSDISQRLIEEYNAKVVGPRKVIIFAFSGHGSEFDEIYASDGELLSIKEEVVLPLVKPKVAYDIPKLFFIDACRGTASLQQKGGDELTSVKEYLDKGYVHVQGNYRIDYATIPDHVSYVDCDGSKWMPELARALREDKDSFQNVADKVKKIVHELPGKKQQCESVSRLNCGPLYLNKWVKI